MKAIDLDIYRDYYHDTQLQDMWDKVSEVIVNHGVLPDRAERAGLLIVEWIRQTWGGKILVERYLDQPLKYSRFHLLHEQAMKVLAELAPNLANHAEIADEIVRVVKKDYRGEYIVKIKALEQLLRDTEIYNLGNSHAKMERLSDTYKISVVRVYQINARMVNNRAKREQPGLPGM